MCTAQGRGTLAQQTGALLICERHKAALSAALYGPVPSMPPFPCPCFVSLWKGKGVYNVDGVCCEGAVA